MDHWLTMRTLEGKTYDHMWGFPADPPADGAAPSARKRRRGRKPPAWRRGIARAVAGART